jgi:hypothetical protein
MSVRGKNQITSGGRYVHLPGRLVTRLTAYHISRHVVSTFKRLATTTTHFDLNHFWQNRQGKTSGHDIAHDPVHYPYSDCRIVNKQLLYRASDRKSPDFYWPYLGPVWFRLSENRLSENQDFLIIRCLENLLSEESRVFGNPDYLYWIVCSDCKMTYMPLSHVIAHFDRISVSFSILSILLV